MKSEPFQPDSWTCNTAQYYGLDTDTGAFTVYNSSEDKRQSFNKRFGVTGKANCPTPFTAACYVGFFGQKTDYPNYNVIETDYVNYSVVYTCEFEKEKPYLWFLCREPVCADEWIEIMMGVAQENLVYFDYDDLISDV